MISEIGLPSGRFTPKSRLGLTGLQGAADVPDYAVDTDCACLCNCVTIHSWSWCQNSGVATSSLPYNPFRTCGIGMADG